MRVTRLMRVATAALLAFSLIPATAMAGETSTNSTELSPTIKVTNSKFDESNFRIKGSMNFEYTKPADSSRVETKENNQHVYEGTLTARISAKDLFADAYKAYKDRFEKKPIPFTRNQVSGLVMFNKDKDQFPSLNYQVTFPEGYQIKSVTTNTTAQTVSSIAQKTVGNTVHLTLNLGNWNDYQGFFKLYENDAKNSNSAVQVTIAYSKNLGDQSAAPTNDYAKGSGNCELYYHGRNIAAHALLLTDKHLVNLSIGEDQFQL